jgi:hypothetical protein
MVNSPRITELEAAAAALPAADRARFERIYAVATVTGELYPPEGLKPWLQERYGSVEQIARQHIVRVDNRVTGEGVLYNE